MIDLRPKSLTRRRTHNRWLVLIAAFKLLQAVLFVAVGVGAFRLLHKDIGDMLERMVNHLRFNPEGRFVNFVLDRASLLNDKMLRRIGLAFFCYAALDLLEGTGLYLEKVWAEYFTLAITASFLPFEVYEIFRKLTLVRVSLLAINALVLIYLAKLIGNGSEVRQFIVNISLYIRLTLQVSANSIVLTRPIREIV